ncbi:Sulfopyruvate decarboxylase subunit alpha [Candidatus Methanobinarius endosymbioticus]|uniref:sulfopyruvate decarboxylase n=1 Tax=Candidatus Methanobinarius endosymbioticus TaxID=2006182 RepID=A0A366M7P0_9EURY|nr:Sulfopyruvate decarboxylase subunit alpha [Candidatus Methanobinarius endosymbioticus]
MDSSEAVYKGLKSAGIDFIVSVPCVNLGKILEIIDEDKEIIHVPVTREEEGIGICAGAYFGGKKTAILMQNSGLGNCVNALGSLYQLYSLPLVMIMSHRGTEGEPIVGQVPMGKDTPKVLDAMDLKYFNPKNSDNAKEIISNSWETSIKEKVPISILLDINYW